MDKDIRVRIDKWLWAARFFKTRSLAAKAVSGGKVHCNTSRVKPSREVKVGDEIRIQKGGFQFVVIVLSLNDRRGPACEAILMYSESEESKTERQQVASERRLKFSMYSQLHQPKKPNKKDRRLIRVFTGKDE